MGKILAIAWKDTLVRFANRSEILFFIVLPVLFTLVIGSMMGGGGGDNRIPLLVVDLDGGELSAELLTELSQSTSVRPVVTARAEAEAQFADQEAPALLIIPIRYTAALIAGEPVELDLRMSPSDANALAAEQAVLASAGRVNRTLAVAHSSLAEAERVRPFPNEAERARYFAESLEAARAQFIAAPERIAVTRPPDTEPAFDMNVQASVGQLITWVFIPLLGISGIFAFERASGTLRRLLTTPTRQFTFLLGTIGGQLTASLIQMALLVGFGVLVMRVSWGQSPAALALMLVAFGLAAVAFGTMLATFVKTESQASGLSVMLGMVMALLGGCWYPLELFPQSVQTLVKVLPTTWAMQGLTDIVLRGQGLVEILPTAAVLFGFAILFFMIGVRRFRFE